MDRNANFLPVSTSSTHPSKKPRADSVLGPSRTTNAPRMVDRLEGFTGQCVRFSYTFRYLFVPVTPTTCRMKTRYPLTQQVVSSKTCAQDFAGAV